MNEMSERLRTARASAGFQNAAQAAEAFGWTYSTYAGHENGSRGYNRTAAEKYGRAFRVKPEWLLFGGDEHMSQAQGNGPISRVEDNEPAPPAARLVRAFDVRASAGHGALVGYEEVDYTLAFPPDYMRRLTSTGPENLAIIGVVGDSMLPTIKEDDIVMVDLTKRNIDYDGMFVVRIGDVLKVKRLRWGPGREKLIVQSDNERYKDEEYDANDGIEVIGRVIWTGGKV